MAYRITAVPVSEDNYAETMDKVVMPYLEAHGGDAYFESFDGNKIHYEHYKADSPEGVIVLVHGFTESVVKFREMSYNFLMMGFNVFAIENRGHGLSYRINPDDPETVTIHSFDDYVKDLDCFIKTVVLPASEGLTPYLYAHSMGGAIGVQYLQTHADVFPKAVLTAPMIMPQTAGLPSFAVKALINPFIWTGKGDKMAFIYHGFNPDYSFENSNDTSRVRFDYYHKIRCATRHLQTSCASYNWVSEAIRVSKRNLDPARCAKIKTEILLCQPEVDKSVVSSAEDDFIKLVKNGRLIKFPASKHEIYASGDETLLSYLTEIEKFLKG